VRTSASAEAVVDADAVRGWRRARPVRIASEEDREPCPDYDGRMTVGQAPKGPDRLPRPRSWAAPTGHRGGAMVAESRGSALVMLRSAEADPHVTKRASSRPASRSAPPPGPRASPPPEGGGLSCGRASLQSGRGHAEPRRPRPLGSTPPPHQSIWRLRRFPLPGFAVNAAPMEQSTSGLYSADESVETHRRFQRCVTRVSHGLGSPSRSCCFRLRPFRSGPRPFAFR
jgi:hypothetical protein